MTVKDSKSSATIRRRKLKPRPEDKERMRESRPTSPAGSDDEWVRDVEDDCHMFDEEVFGPSIIRKLMASNKTLFLALLALRTVNALMIQTHFVPDEYWQSLEVAHHMVFGYGFLTWEWAEAIRSYLHPFLFATLFKVLAILGLDTRILLIKLPRMLQAAIAAVGDLYLYRLSWKLADRATAQWALLCQVLNWFMLYCSTRTLSNSTETALVTVALFYFPWPGHGKFSTGKFLLFAALAVVIRPTSAILWVLMCAWHLQRQDRNLLQVLRQYLVVGGGVLAMSCVLDRIFYDRWVLTHLNFLRFNVLSGGAATYGTHPWHWYLSQGLPVILGVQLLLFLLGAWQARNKVLLFLILWTIFIYSFLPHKEFRFLMPVLPLCMHYCGVFLQSLCRMPRMKKRKSRHSTPTQVSAPDGKESNDSALGETPDSSQPASLNDSFSSSASTSQSVDSAQDGCDARAAASVQDDPPEVSQKRQHKENLSKARKVVIFLVVFNLPLALYFGLIHQRGTVEVTRFLWEQSQDRDISVLFLMPCHSTPAYSYIHQNVSIRFLTCEPNLSQRDGYVDEADQFFRDPVLWLKQEYVVSRRPWPSHLVYFSPLLPSIAPLLAQSGYQPCATFFHTHLPEGRVGTQVLVSCR